MHLKPLYFFLSLFLILSTDMVFAQQSQVYRVALNKKLQPLPSEKFAYAVEERSYTKGVWKAKLINNETGHLIAEYGYADSTRQTKHGTYTEYLPNRKKRLELTYNMGVEDGPFTEWQFDGTIFQKGNRKGTQLWGHYENYFADGSLKYVCETDQMGNGTGKEYLSKVGITGEGMVKNMRQTGTWVYKDSANRKQMEVIYGEEGELEKETCFDADENPKTDSECMSDRRPEFPGGATGWQQFLEKNLTYPKNARKLDIQGVVYLKFNVKEDGSLTNIRVYQSPDPELSAEAIRVVRLSPKWTPAVEANKVVPFVSWQSITFQLK